MWRKVLMAICFFFLMNGPAWASITQKIVLPRTILVYALVLGLIGFTLNVFFPRFVFLTVVLTILFSSRAILVCNDPFVGRDLMIQYGGRYEFYAVGEILVILVANFVGSIFGNFREKNTID